MRSILIKAIVEVWGEGETNEELNASIAAFPEDRRLPYIAEAGSSLRTSTPPTINQRTESTHPCEFSPRG